MPGIRYLFVIIMWALRLPAGDSKPVDGDNRRGRVCCAIVVIALLASLLPGMPRGAADALTATALLVLVYSFGSDVRFLLSRFRDVRSST